MNDSHVSVAVDAAKEAGEAILKLYGKSLYSEQKYDGSPLTHADQASHNIISTLLDKTGIPVVSEEGVELHLSARHYWLVDPLDGTKDFLATNDEFTVNIALIEDGSPTLGVLYAPALDEMYVGVPGESAWLEQRGTQTLCRLACKSPRLRMAISRFHNHSDTVIFAKENQVAERIPIGSALKYGRLALGKIDVYPRLVGTSEWDTAAGQAILEAVGGHILDWNTGESLRYGKPHRRNGRFIAFRAPYQTGDFNLMVYGSECL